MKVKELIEMLKGLPQDSELYIAQPEWWEGDTIYEPYEGQPGGINAKKGDDGAYLPSRKSKNSELIWVL